MENKKTELVFYDEEALMGTEDWEKIWLEFFEHSRNAIIDGFFQEDIDAEE